MSVSRCLHFLHGWLSLNGLFTQIRSYHACAFPPHCAVTGFPNFTFTFQSTDCIHSRKRNTLLPRDAAMPAWPGLGSHNSVCPSVCHTRALWLIQRTYWQYFYTRQKGNPSSFLCQRSRRNSNRVTPDGCAKQRRGKLKWRFSTNIWLYLTNGAKQGHSYYGTLIGTRMCSIDQ